MLHKFVVNYIVNFSYLNVVENFYGAFPVEATYKEEAELIGKAAISNFHQKEWPWKCQIDVYAITMAEFLAKKPLHKEDVFNS